MLPGQPVSLLGPCGDEHGPGVRVNTLGQHLLGQESKGNHEGPEQEQRAGPQIHQSIGVPLAGEQEGPGSSRSSGLPASAPRGTPASLPRWRLLSPREHGDKAVTAGTERPGQQYNLQRDGRAVRPQGTSPPTQGGQLWHWARGPRHTAPVPTAAAAGSEPLFTLSIAQCALTVCAYKHERRTSRGEGSKGGGARQGKPCLLLPWSAADRLPSPTRTGLSGHRAGSNRDGKPASPVPSRDQRRCPQILREEPRLNETGRRKARESPCSPFSRAPGPSTSTASDGAGSAWQQCRAPRCLSPAAAQLCPSTGAQHGDTGVTHLHNREETGTGMRERGAPSAPAHTQGPAHRDAWGQEGTHQKLGRQVESRAGRNPPGAKECTTRWCQCKLHRDPEISGHVSETAGKVRAGSAQSSPIPLWRAGSLRRCQGRRAAPGSRRRPRRRLQRRQCRD